MTTRSPSPIHYEHRPRGEVVGGGNSPPPPPYEAPVHPRGNYDRRYNGGRSRSRSPARPYYQNDYNRRTQRQYSRSPSPPRGRPHFVGAASNRGGYGNSGIARPQSGGSFSGRYRSPSPPRGGYGGRPYYGGSGGRRDDYQSSGYRRDYSRSPSPYRRHYSRRQYSPPSRRPHFERRPRRDVFKGTEEDRLASTTLFVGNIPFAWVEKDVIEMFGEFGPISTVSIPENRHSMRNKGFCFVHFENKANAEEAFARYNDADVEGRKLRIDWDVGRDRKESFRPSGAPPPPPSSSMNYDDQRPNDDQDTITTRRSPSMERF